MKRSLDDCVYLCMKDGRWWTFWGLQQTIKARAGRFYGEPSISAAIRNLRKLPAKYKYNLPEGDVVARRRISGGRGYEYRLRSSLTEPSPDAPKRKRWEPEPDKGLPFNRVNCR